MTKVELLARLAEVAVCGDTAEAHEQADDALLDFIGDAEISKAYSAVPKWYS